MNGVLAFWKILFLNVSEKDCRQAARKTSEHDWNCRSVYCRSVVVCMCRGWGCTKKSWKSPALNPSRVHESDISTARFGRLDQKTTGDSAEVTRFGCSGQKIVCFKNAKPPLKTPACMPRAGFFLVQTLRQPVCAQALMPRM